MPLASLSFCRLPNSERHAQFFVGQQASFSSHPRCRPCPAFPHVCLQHFAPPSWTHPSGACPLLAPLPPREDNQTIKTHTPPVLGLPTLFWFPEPPFRQPAWHTCWPVAAEPRVPRAACRHFTFCLLCTTCAPPLLCKLVPAKVAQLASPAGLRGFEAKGCWLMECYRLCTAQPLRPHIMSHACCACCAYCRRGSSWNVTPKPHRGLEAGTSTRCMW